MIPRSIVCNISTGVSCVGSSPYSKNQGCERWEEHLVHTADRQQRIYLVTWLHLQPGSQLICNRLSVSFRLVALYLARLVQQNVNPVLRNFVFGSCCCLLLEYWFLNTITGKFELLLQAFACFVRCTEYSRLYTNIKIKVKLAGRDAQNEEHDNPHQTR
jgi:hypothetical protein